MDIGIIGTGNISTFLLQQHDKIKTDYLINITSIFGRNKEIGNKLAEKYKVKFFDNFKEFINSPLDIVVEAANIEAAKEFALEVLLHDKDLVLSSVGVLAEADIYKEIKAVSKSKNRNIYIPSGAIGGIDVIKAASALNELYSVSITTRKSFESLGIEEGLLTEKIVYEGNAFGAINSFPKNINVAITVALAGIGMENTQVTIIADRHITNNTHTIEMIGEFGRARLEIENEPMPSNPKTSYMAALSILSLLQSKEEKIKIGS